LRPATHLANLDFPWNAQLCCDQAIFQLDKSYGRRMAGNANDIALSIKDLKGKNGPPAVGTRHLS